MEEIHKFTRDKIRKMLPNIFLLLLRLFTAAFLSVSPAFTEVDYVEYLSSSGLNVVLSAPHGGQLVPANIPDRYAGCWNGTRCVWTHTCGTKNIDLCKAQTIMDLHTAQLTRELRIELCRRCGGECPSAIINGLNRKKMDANREKGEATFGVPEAVLAFDKYHSYINKEKAILITNNTRGLFIDIHGHGHAIQRAELGYLLTSNQLNNVTDLTQLVDHTSVNGLWREVGGDFDALIRGRHSFGGMLQAQGIESVPSPADPGPGVNPYFSGGHNIYVHGSLNDSPLDGIQIELPKSFREPSARPKYVQVLGSTIVKYLNKHYGIKICS